MISALESEITVPVSFLCKHFGSSRSGYYQWKNRGKTVRFVKKESVCKAIRKAFLESDGTYGSPRIYDELVDLGLRVSENTIAKYMVEMGLDARLRKRFRVQTTDSKHQLPIAERLFKVEDHQTLPTAPGQVLAGDITYLKSGKKFIYLAVVMDIFTREIVGWSIDTSLHTELILKALDGAIRTCGPDAEIIFHSDRGSQYASAAYRRFCRSNSVIPSMSRRGNCYDNAYVESWFSSLKKERIYRNRYDSEAELRADVFDYIAAWYNTRRKHSALGYKSPRQFKNEFVAAQ